MSEYIKYSIRHGITDPDLAGLLDYLERNMGEDQIYVHDDGSTYVISFGISNIEAITLCKRTKLPMLFTGHDGTDISMPTRLFYRTYRTLLPEIRDLYSNQQ